MSKAGVAAESEVQKLLFATQEECQTKSLSTVDKAVTAVAQDINHTSKFRDTNGSHTYYGGWLYR
jgi:hypothetical protein